MNSVALVRKSLPNIILALLILVSFAAYQSPAIEEFKNKEQLPSESGTFIRKIVEQTLSGQLESAPAPQKEIVLNQVTGEIIHEANTFLRPYFQYVPPALAFGLFLVLWGLGWIFIWSSVLLGILIFFIMKKLGFIKLEQYDTRAERIVI